MSDDEHMRYTYRLRVSNTACRALLSEWDKCRWVWNECVAASQRAYRDGEKVGPAALDRMLTRARRVTPWLRAGSSVPQHQRAGMPRFKKKDDAAPTVNYTQRGFRLRDGRLVLAGGIEVRPVWSRELPDVPSSVRVYRDPVGHWYASFVVPAQTEPSPETGRVLGVDWGVTETATTSSDAYDLPHAQHGKQAQARLARYQRMMARRRTPKGTRQSRGYRKAQRAAATQHRRVSRRRQDDARKWATRVATDHDRIAVEDFRPKFLGKTTMARKAADAAISATKHELVNQGRKHARDVRLVDPTHTTMDCGRCLARTKHALPLSERTYTCTTCGTSTPRDKNSARVMLVRAGFVPAGADGVSPRRPLEARAA